MAFFLGEMDNSCLGSTTCLSSPLSLLPVQPGTRIPKSTESLWEETCLQTTFRYLQDERDARPTVEDSVMCLCCSF